VTEILRADRWGTNARMIAEAVMPLGYIEDDVFDATYGRHGGFWTDWRPDDLTTNDLNAEYVDHHYDFRALPFGERSFTTVVFDPPYKLNGTPTMGDMDSRFGVGQRMTRDEKLAMIRDGAIECWRITDERLLVKVMDQVVGGRVRWMARMVTDALEPLGASLADQFQFLITPRPQPPRRCPRCRGTGVDPEPEPCHPDGPHLSCRMQGCVNGRVPCPQEHARSNYSTLLVFER